MDVSQKIRDLRQFWEQITWDSARGTDSNEKERGGIEYDHTFEAFNCKSDHQISRIGVVPTKVVSFGRVCAYDSFINVAFVAWLLCFERVYWSGGVGLAWIRLEEGHNLEFLYTLSRDGNQVHATMHPFPSASKPFLETN